MKAIAEAACAHLAKPGWTGSMLADAKAAVERIEAVAARADEREAAILAILAQMQAENQRHGYLLDELRAERHRLEALAARVETALNPPCRHPTQRWFEGKRECLICGDDVTPLAGALQARDGTPGASGQATCTCPPRGLSVVLRGGYCADCMGRV